MYPRTWSLNPYTDLPLSLSINPEVNRPTRVRKWENWTTTFMIHLLDNGIHKSLLKKFFFTTYPVYVTNFKRDVFSKIDVIQSLSLSKHS